MTDHFLKFLDQFRSDDHKNLIESIKHGYNILSEGLFNGLFDTVESYSLNDFIEDYSTEGFTQDVSDDEKYIWLNRMGMAGWMIDGYVVPVDYKGINQNGTISIKGQVKNVGDEDFANVAISDILIPKHKYWALFK